MQEVFRNLDFSQAETSNYQDIHAFFREIKRAPGGSIAEANRQEMRWMTKGKGRKSRFPTFYAPLHLQQEVKTPCLKTRC